MVRDGRLPAKCSSVSSPSTSPGTTPAAVSCAMTCRAFSLDPGVLEEVLNRYGEHRLLTFDRHPITRTPTVEIAHEALITHWDRLRGWIDDRREDLVLHRRLGDAATERDSARAASGLPACGGRLQQMESLAASSDLALSETERGLLQTSRVEEDRQRDRRTKRRRAVLGGFAAAALSLGLAGWALVNQVRPRRRRPKRKNNERSPPPMSSGPGRKPPGLSATRRWPVPGSGCRHQRAR